jgi:hypothetical protein
VLRLEMQPMREDHTVLPFFMRGDMRPGTALLHIAANPCNPHIFPIHLTVRSLPIQRRVMKLESRLQGAKQ